jgi:hypothetical protein
MTSRTFRHRFAPILAAVAMVLAAAGLRADEAPPGVLAFTLEVPAGKLSTKEVHDVVVTASTDRGWSLKDDSTERVVVYINKHKHEATVVYLISDKQVQAYCEGYITDGNGKRTGVEQPTSWLKNLNGDITKGMGRAASANGK